MWNNEGTEKRLPFMGFFHILFCDYFFFFMENTLLPFVTEFWNRLGITTENISVESTWEDINIRIETPDSALLIGMHGKNIEALQHLLGRMIEHKTEKFVHVHLEINDYMKLKDEKLFRFLDSKIAIVQMTGTAIRLPTLTAYERKKSHNYISEKSIPGLKTESEGEWSERALVLSYNKDMAIWEKSEKHIPSEPLISDEGVGI